MAKKEKKPDPNVVSQETAIEICNEAGLEPVHIAWLLDSLRKLGTGKNVTRQSSGPVLRGKSRNMSIDTAIDMALQRAEQRREREEIIKANRFIKSEPAEQKPFSTENNIYPKRVSPVDIGRSLDAARLKLAQKRAKNMPGEERIRAEIVLRVIDRIKNLEAMRVARRIALRQKKAALSKNREELEQEKRIDVNAVGDLLEEERQRVRSLDGFGTKGLHTLLDEAAEVVQADYDASAKVLNQWIGTDPTPQE